MIEEQGRVLAISGRFAEVQTQRRGLCGLCAVQGACGTALLGRLLGRRPVQFRALNQAHARVGDRVLIGISEEGLLAAASAAYLGPILALIAGALLGEALGGPFADVASLFGAGLGFTLAIVWLRGYSEAAALDPGRQPVVLRRLESNST